MTMVIILHGMPLNFRISESDGRSVSRFKNTLNFEVDKIDDAW